MIYKKKDISDMFREITSYSLVAGNNSSVISSNGVSGFWGSHLTIRLEDGTYHDPGALAEDGGWEDFS